VQGLKGAKTFILYTTMNFSFHCAISRITCTMKIM
ncbi:uncharacterized protein J3R85_004328, partial [Psidium guajava]